MDLDALEAAGLYEPTAPDAPGRAELLSYLLDSGASVGELVDRATAGGNLTSLLFDRRLSRGELSAAELADRTGTPLGAVLETYRILGVRVADPHAAVFDVREARLLELLQRARPMLPEGMPDEILRSTGEALMLVSESKVAAFMGSVEDQLATVSPRARAEITTAAGELALELGGLLEPLLRHHLRAAVQRHRAAMGGSADRLESQVAVGFVDLVGFTSDTASMGASALLAFMQRFHERTFDVVSAAGGRVVKHIGDEIMFSSADADDGCQIALALIDAFPDAGSLARGGLAHGIVVARHGDYYGPVVNLAARLADVAVPGEVLADERLASAASDRFTFAAAGRRSLKGFATPVAVVAVARAAA